MGETQIIRQTDSLAGFLFFHLAFDFCSISGVPENSNLVVKTLGDARDAVVSSRTLVSMAAKPRHPPRLLAWHPNPAARWWLSPTPFSAVSAS